MSRCYFTCSCNTGRTRGHLSCPLLFYLQLQHRKDQRSPFVSAAILLAVATQEGPEVTFRVRCYFTCSCNTGRTRGHLSCPLLFYLQLQHRKDQRSPFVSAAILLAVATQEGPEVTFRVRCYFTCSCNTGRTRGHLSCPLLFYLQLQHRKDQRSPFVSAAILLAVATQEGPEVTFRVRCYFTCSCNTGRTRGHLSCPLLFYLQLQHRKDQRVTFRVRCYFTCSCNTGRTRGHLSCPLLFYLQLQHRKDQRTPFVSAAYISLTNARSIKSYYFYYYISRIIAPSRVQTNVNQLEYN